MGKYVSGASVAERLPGLATRIPPVKRIDNRIIAAGIAALTPLIGATPPANVRVVPASELIGMDEHPARALVRKKDASIVVATKPRSTNRSRAASRTRPRVARARSRRAGARSDRMPRT